MAPLTYTLSSGVKVAVGRMISTPGLLVPLSTINILPAVRDVTN